MVLKLWFASESPSGLVNIHMAGPTLQVLIQYVWDRDPEYGNNRICISNNFSGDADVAGPENTL